MGKASTMQWNLERERKLFLAIIQELKPSTTAINWDNVSEMLGYEHCTPTACSNKLNKIKIAIKKEFGEKGASEDGSGTPKATKASGGKKKRKASSQDDGEDDETPSKKKKACPSIKQDPEDEDEDELV